MTMRSSLFFIFLKFISPYDFESSVHVICDDIIVYSLLLCFFNHPMHHGGVMRFEFVKIIIIINKRQKGYSNL